MAKREFLMLAKTYSPDSGYIADWFVSEKLDGMRVWWDGGVTRGILKSEVPWANTSKDGRYKEAPIATGLWTRYGNVIHAPSEWLDQLPKISLDGELYIPGHRQFMMSIVKKLVPDINDWKRVGYHVFDIPPIETVLMPGVIKNPNAYQYWTQESLDKFLGGEYNHWDHCVGPNTRFRTRIKIMERFLHGEELSPVVMHPQSKLPTINADARKMVDNLLERVVTDGGEGLILRSPDSLWQPHRMAEMLKVKPFDDMEVKVVGYITGKGKHRGRMGSLIVESPYGRFGISGFTDEERSLSPTSYTYAFNNQGVERLGFSEFELVCFNIGDIITIKHRGFSADHIPQEARYWRKRVEI